MPLQLRLVRQNAVQTAVQARVVDLAIFDLQQIVERRRGIPALFDRQFAAWRELSVSVRRAVFGRAERSTSDLYPAV
jgi:hypothetical protein